jgi:autotransporter-associated beta strand protein
MVLVFKPNNNADYRSTNDANRASGVDRAHLSQGFQDIPGLGEVMLNEIRFQGQFSGAVARKATIDGKPLLFVKNLSGKLPGLRLDATQGSANYTYQLNLDLILYHDFVIEGDGTANFQIGGVMRNFYQPSGVRKRGSSTVTLTAHNTFTGPAIVEAGRVVLNGLDAALDGPSEVTVQAGGRLTLQSGLIRTNKFDISQGQFDFLGGTVQVDQVVGSLTNSAGAVVVGANPQTMTISNNLSQTGGVLRAILDGHVPGSPTDTLLSVSGSAQLGGKLSVAFDNSSLFPVGSSIDLLIAAGGITGTFSQLDFSSVPAGTQWAVNYGANTVTLSRLANLFNNADFDRDGVVTGRDWLLWQRNAGGPGPIGDANGDGLVDAADVSVLRSQFGSVPASMAAVKAVPEPSAILLSLGTLTFSLRTRAVGGRRNMLASLAAGNAEHRPRSRSASDAFAAHQTASCDLATARCGHCTSVAT